MPDPVDRAARWIRRAMSGATCGAIVFAFLSVIAISAIEASVVGAQASEEFLYDYFKEPITLTLDLSRIAVLGSGADTPTEAFSAGSGSWSEHPIEGWWWYTPESPWRDASSVRSAVADLLAVATESGPEIRFVSPVFKRGEETLFLTRLLLMQTTLPEPLTDEDRGLVRVFERDWSGLDGGYRLESLGRSGFDLLEASQRIARRSNTVFCEPNFVFTGRVTSILPNDPEFFQQWGMHNTGQGGGVAGTDVDAPIAWGNSQGDPSIRVVIIDAGVELDHPDLHTLPGVDVTSQGPGDGSPLNDCDFHGTIVSGPISGILGNGIGIAGIAPECPSVPARTMISDVPCDGTWVSEFQWTVDTLDYALLSGARVTNNSNSYGAPSAAITTKYSQTRIQGLVHFSGTGNDGQEELVYPGSVSSVNAVSAIDRNGDLADFSSYGDGVAFTAPGVSVRTTDLDAGYRWASGTSLAAPHAAAVAALVLSIDPTQSSFEVENLLEATATDLGAPGLDSQFGYGIVNAGRAATNLTGGSFFRRGDVNADGVNDIADPVAALDQLFGASFVSCENAVDANDDEQVDVADIIFLLNLLFEPGSPEPAFPFASCGFDITFGPLSCDCFPGCP